MKERSEMNKASPAFDDSTIADYDYGPKQRLRDKAFLEGKTVDLKKKSMCAVDVSTGHGASDERLGKKFEEGKTKRKKTNRKRAKLRKSRRRRAKATLTSEEINGRAESMVVPRRELYTQ
ncbi:unnamed protein product [Arabidopsis lyrata]|uniref:Predicted protein n=1 Tax=Arabidopsis lyrata subsp. lyrata TaxID=81972 RepID=D7MPJ4_ARALL|nr:predicted protein [Arabidopsis lyrata subsp. lyrata]CAH8279116.1 unnamed protein product [Arabidopsis lyrata]